MASDGLTFYWCMRNHMYCFQPSVTIAPFMQHIKVSASISTIENPIVLTTAYKQYCPVTSGPLRSVLCY